MTKQETKSVALDLSTHEVPYELLDLYDAIQASSGSAFKALRQGETHFEQQWRKASRLCREFLAKTEEPAQLAFASQLGNWAEAREASDPPENPYTYLLWLAAKAWQLLQFCMEQPHYSFIDPVRQYAREGIIAVRSAPSLQRVLAHRVLSGERKIEDRVRGPKLQPAGSTPSVRFSPTRRKRKKKSKKGRRSKRK